MDADDLVALSSQLVGADFRVLDRVRHQLDEIIDTVGLLAEREPDAREQERLSALVIELSDARASLWGRLMQKAARR